MLIRSFERLSVVETLVSLDTLLRWHRQLIVRKYDGNGRLGPGPPRVLDEVRRLIVRDQPLRSATRIVRVLRGYGLRLSERAVAREPRRVPGKLPRGLTVQRAVWAKSVVIDRPRLDRRLGVGIERGNRPVARRLPSAHIVAATRTSELSGELCLPTPTGQQVPSLRLT